MVKRVGAWLFHLLGLMAKLPRQSVCELCRHVALRLAKARMQARGEPVEVYAIAVTSVRTVDTTAKAPTRAKVARMKACICAAPYAAASVRLQSDA